MNYFLECALANAIVATLLALLAAGVARFANRPALAHTLWLLVLLKLITPPLFRVPVPWPAAADAVLSAVVPAPLEAVPEKDLEPKEQERGDQD